MFEGFSKQTIEFMWGIKLNNEKSWFEAHKKEYIKDFLSPMNALRQDVYECISSEFKGYGFISKVSRIYKDARRIHNGEPYRSNLWFSIERPSEEWTSTPVFWFELAPENWSYGLGYYRARPDTMIKFRARIDNNPGEFEKLIYLLETQDEFILEGPEYARKKDSPSPKTTLWYNKKSFSLIHNQLNSEELFSEKLKQRVINGFSYLMPFYDYLNTLDHDKG